MSDQLCAACGQHPAYLRCPGEHVDELATLRADLARVKAERGGFEDGLTIANNAAERRGRERDAARTQVRELTAELTLTEKRRAEAQRAVHAAMVNIGTLQDQVRELQKVARAAAAWKRAVPRPMFNVLGSSVVQPLWDAVDAASFDVCHEDQCPRLSTWWRVAVGNAAWESCDEHIAGFRAEDAKAESKGCRRREGWREREGADEVRAFGAAIEAAERALGRRK